MSKTGKEWKQKTLSQIVLFVAASLNRSLRNPDRYSRKALPARPDGEGRSGAVAPGRPSRGPGGVFDKNEDRKGRQGAGPELPKG